MLENKLEKLKLMLQEVCEEVGEETELEQVFAQQSKDLIHTIHDLKKCYKNW